MKHIILVLLIMATPLIIAAPFDGKWEVCNNYFNFTDGKSCDEWWANATNFELNNYTLLNNSWNITDFENNLKTFSTNYSDFLVDNLPNITALNETRVKEIIAGTTFQLNMTSVGNQAIKEIDKALNTDGKIDKAIKTQFDKFQSEIPTLTLINSVVLLIFIIALAFMMRKKKEEFPNHPGKF